MIPSKDLIFDIYEKVNGRSDSDWVEIAQEHGLDISTETLRKAGHAGKAFHFQFFKINFHDVMFLRIINYYLLPRTILYLKNLHI